MTDFAPLGRFDLAACVLCSASYLLTDQAVLSHFACVRASLADDGLYILELTHPSELNGARKTKSSWKMADGVGELDIAWLGDPAAAADGIWRSEVSLSYRPFDGSSPFSVEAEAQQRGFTYPELVELAQRAGFGVHRALGGFDENVPLDDPKAMRMILVLKQN